MISLVAPVRLQITNDLATAWRNLVPMAVERGRRTYSHLRGCRLLSHDEDSSEECLCLCGADKVRRTLFRRTFTDKEELSLSVCTQ